MKSALIAGATGLTGKKLLFSLLSNKEYVRVFIMVRKELAIKDSKLTQLVINYEKPFESQSLPEVDEVYCCLGTTIKKAGSEEAFRLVDYTYPLTLATYCSTRHTKKFLVITALGSDSKSSIFYNRVKGELELALQKLPFEALYICRPSLLLGDRDESRIGESIAKIIAKFISIFLFGPLKKYRAIEAMVVAKAMISLASRTEKGVHIIESDKLQELGMSDESQRKKGYEEIR